MAPDEIIAKLGEGYELANRGTGWWLSAPRKAYKKAESVQIEDASVNALVENGVIRTELPYTTIFARLNEEQENT